MIRHLRTSASSANGTLTIDLDAIALNYHDLSRLAWPADVAGVVKADAYGLGARKVVRKLGAAGCRQFFVAHLEEAEDIRPALPEDACVYVLNGIPKGHESRALEISARPVLNSLDQVEAWHHAARRTGQRLQAALQVDTGMSRLGLPPGDVDRLVCEPDRLSGIDPTLLISHLACADDACHPANAQQLKVFKAFASLFPGIRLSLANSAGVFLGEAYRGNLVRPGIALYGGNPTAGSSNPMRPVIRLSAYVIQIRAIAAGTGVGYGLTHVVPGAARLATIGVGYADGLLRSLSDRGAVYFQGIRLPIVGRVSMDSIVVDITELPEGLVGPGSTVELIGPNQTVDDIANDAGTIAYEILTSLGDRYHRVYLGE